MTSINIVRFLHVLSYVVVASQLIFYLTILSGSLKLIPIENYLELRKTIDSFGETKFKIIYYTCLLLSVCILLLSMRKPLSPLFITSAIAFICLLIDMIIAIKGNIPLNNLTNNYLTLTDPINWEQVRIQWL